MEFNFRFAPGYQPANPFNRGGWTAAVQVGASFKLASIGKGLRGKKN
jgi:hypothetical protein